MKAIERKPMSEAVMAGIWRRQLLSSPLPVGSTRLEVVYPGRENPDRGPDFTGAILATEDGELLRGDVELHLRAGDWKAHGHHQDPAYEDVILQVVWEGKATDAVLNSGRMAPTLVLSQHLSLPLDEARRQAALPSLLEEPCARAGERLGCAGLGQLLDKMGDERFWAKVSRFETALALEDAPQVLYQGLMRALGYAKNKHPFEELGRLLPLSVLEGFAWGRRGEEQVAVLQSLLLGTAGLLACAPELETVWQTLGCQQVMRREQWRLFRVRPENQPTRRLVAASYLIARYLDTGLLEGFLALLKTSDAAGDLESGLIVSAMGITFLGRGRAGEVVVNVVLPFFAAWAEASSRGELRRRVLGLYRSYPRLGDNESTRRMAKLLGEEGQETVNSARRQQGLLHLDSTFCSERRCARCPLGAAAPAG